MWFQFPSWLRAVLLAWLVYWCLQVVFHSVWFQVPSLLRAVLLGGLVSSGGVSPSVVPDSILVLCCTFSLTGVLYVVFQPVWFWVQSWLSAVLLLLAWLVCFMWCFTQCGSGFNLGLVIFVSAVLLDWAGIHQVCNWSGIVRNTGSRNVFIFWRMRLQTFCLFFSCQTSGHNSAPVQDWTWKHTGWGGTPWAVLYWTGPVDVLITAAFAWLAKDWKWCMHC